MPLDADLAGVHGLAGLEIVRGAVGKVRIVARLFFVNKSTPLKAHHLIGIVGYSLKM
jgi:hypothetical protein